MLGFQPSFYIKKISHFSVETPTKNLIVDLIFLSKMSFIKFDKNIFCHSLETKKTETA